MSLNTQTVSAKLKNGNYIAWEVTAEQCSDEPVILSIKNGTQNKSLVDAISDACCFGYSEYGDWPVDSEGKSYCAKDGWPIQIKEIDELDLGDEEVLKILEEERNSYEDDVRDI